MPPAGPYEPSDLMHLQQGLVGIPGDFKTTMGDYFGQVQVLEVLWEMEAGPLSVSIPAPAAGYYTVPLVATAKYWNPDPGFASNEALVVELARSPGGTIFMVLGNNISPNVFDDGVPRAFRFKELNPNNGGSPWDFVEREITLTTGQPSANGRMLIRVYYATIEAV